MTFGLVISKMDNKKITYELYDKEIKLIEYCRDVKYGQVVIFLENGQPVRIEEVKKSIKL